MVDRERAGDLHLLAERERAGDDLLRQLVGGDRGDGDRSRGRPTAAALRRAAARRRGSAAARSSTTRRGRRAAGDSRRAGSVTAARLPSRPRCRASSTARPRAARPGSPCRRPRSVPYSPASIRASASRPGGAGRARPPRAPRRARARRSRVAVSARWLSALDDISSPVSSSSDALPMSWCSIVLSSRSRCSSSIRAEVVGVDVIRSGSPVRPPWRAVARSRPARCRPARRSCFGRNRPKRA